jgi:TPR repeat protein
MWSANGGDLARARAAAMLDYACELGELAACAFGSIHFSRVGTLRDVPRGKAMLGRACDGGVAAACRKLAAAVPEMAATQDATGVSPEQRRYLLSAECIEGRAEACFEVGLDMHRGLAGFPRDPVRAVAAYERGCAAGSEGSCNNLGDALEFGEGTSKDARRAVELYDRACRAGEALACSNLGRQYFNGTVVARDLKRAILEFKAACDGHDEYGCLHLRQSREPSLPANGPAAVAQWKRLCATSNARACLYLGLAYIDPVGDIERDEQKAKASFERACKGGDTDACTFMKSRFR